MRSWWTGILTHCRWFLVTSMNTLFSRCLSPFSTSPWPFSILACAHKVTYACWSSDLVAGISNVCINLSVFDWRDLSLTLTPSHFYCLSDDFFFAYFTYFIILCYLCWFILLILLILLLSLLFISMTNWSGPLFKLINSSLFSPGFSSSYSLLSVAGGKSRSSYYLQEQVPSGNSYDDLSNSYQSLIAGFGFASFFYFCAFVLAVACGFHISPLANGYEKNTFVVLFVGVSSLNLSICVHFCLVQVNCFPLSLFVYKLCYLA